ncbi:tripartite tricarboxylate transporter substrate binding protein [soil metagenome]
MKCIKTLLVSTCLTAAACLMSMHADAQSPAPNAPTGPLRIVATSTPGSSVDVFSRAVGDRLAANLNRTVVIENRAGGGGTVAATEVLNGATDGSVVLANSSAHVTTPYIYPKLSFDILRDLTAVVPLAVLPSVLIVPGERDWKTLADLIAAGKEKPGKLFYGTVGSGTSTHMSAELLRLRAGMQAVQVPFKGSPEVLLEVASGRIDWAILPASTVLPQLKDGRVRAIAISADKRVSQLPDVPTIAEAGLADADFPLWIGLFVSSKTPPAAVKRLHDETTRALASPEVRERFDKLGAEPMPMSSDEFNALVLSQATKAADIVKATNMKAN